jgi:hypothetical protein
MKILKLLVLSLALGPLPVTAGPAQCWYYVHGKLFSPTVEACIAKADVALRSEGFEPGRRESSDSYISYMTAENVRTTAQIMCYEVNGQRGKVMAFITVAGARACPVADNLFGAMSRPESDL